MKVKTIISLILTLFAGVTILQSQQMLKVKGSDTMVNLVQALAESYMEKYPEKVISVSGGGSGTGIASIINRQCDIANSSREIKTKEVFQAKQNGLDPLQIPIAIDALAIVVNPNNPVKKLTVEEVGAIYAGKIKNWKEVGGPNKPITLYGRQPNSGTYDFMKDVVIKGDYSKEMREMNGTSQIVEALKTDISGIGYVGVGYLRDAGNEISPVEIARKKGEKYYDPLNVQDVLNGNYPITRALYQIVDKKQINKNKEVKNFLKFELSEDGQKIVEEMGFYRLAGKYLEMKNKLGLGF
jgi:phosphate transport system substrate-binding protein